MLVRTATVACLSILSLTFPSAPARGDEPAAAAKSERGAVERALTILQKGARNYPSHRECFACHHQTLPLLGMSSAASAGITVDDILLPEIVEFTQNSFRDQIDKLERGEGIGGKGLTVGYGLWTLNLGRTPPDDLTTAMVTYLLKTQESDGHWGLHSIRPPAEESLVMCTVVAASGIKSFATATQRAEASLAIDKARAWLNAAKLEFHEDHVARVWGLGRLGGDTDEQFVAARAGLLATQKSDGGWAQTADRESDGYATGTALYVLLDTLTSTPYAVRDQSSNTAEAPVSVAMKRAAAWLIDHQGAEGAWHVPTRAKPVQVYFDNGDPHGKDQFLSIAATGWAAAALARTIDCRLPPPGAIEAQPATRSD